MGLKTLLRGSAVMAAVSLMLPATTPAQSDHAGKAGVVTTLQGTATVARTTAAQPAALKFKDDVFLQDRIATGDQSLARILLGGKAVVTVRERSVLTITETASTSTLEISSGARASRAASSSRFSRPASECAGAPVCARICSINSPSRALPVNTICQPLPSASCRAAAAKPSGG